MRVPPPKGIIAIRAIRDNAELFRGDSMGEQKKFRVDLKPETFKRLSILRIEKGLTTGDDIVRLLLDYYMSMGAYRNYD